MRRERIPDCTPQTHRLCQVVALGPEAGTPRAIDLPDASSRHAWMIPSRLDAEPKGTKATRSEPGLTMNAA